MHYRTLGKTGLKVSVIGFGTIKFPQIDPKQASEAINRALDLGINFIDTARNYGDSERKIGLAIRGRREECYIATKTSSRTYEGAMRDLETSLKELQTDYIDLWQLHNICDMKRWREVTAPGGALEAAREAKEEGKVRHIGISSHRALDVMKEAIRCGDFETIMVLYNPLDEENTGHEIIPLAQRHNIGVIAMKPLSGGTLALPLSDEERERNHRSSGGEWFDPIVRGCLRFIISNPAVSTVIPGMRFTWEVEENVKSADMPPMTQEEKDALIRGIGKLRKTYKYSQECLRCGYCLDACPQNIQIPEVFRAVYVYRAYPEETRYMGLEIYQSLAVSPEECIECRSCVERCPAGIEIPERLKEAAEFFKEVIRG
ncbi:MAG: aldo/keto reductase [Candidatus Bathyarchaeota archaeon B63]|nr:MAG: aldo/keto reductase [Candidatus Bathyarchaeota archaeon B63]